MLYWIGRNFALLGFRVDRLGLNLGFIVGLQGCLFGLVCCVGRTRYGLCIVIY